MKLFNSGKLKGMYTGPDKGGMGNSRKTKAIPLPRDITKREGSSTKMPRVKSETESEKKLRLMKSASKRANKGMSKLLAGRGRKKGPSGRK